MLRIRFDAHGTARHGWAVSGASYKPQFIHKRSGARAPLFPLFCVCACVRVAYQVSPQCEEREVKTAGKKERKSETKVRSKAR